MTDQEYGTSSVAAAIHLTRGQLLDLVLDVEDRLRLLIRAVFVKARGDWESLIPKSMRSELTEMRGKAPDPRQDLLDLASLKQLIDILSNQWKYFAPILHDKAVIHSWLEELRKYRNALAHGQHPDLDEKVKIVLVVGEVSTLIPAPSARLTPARSKGGFALVGRTILWADDHPENNRAERRHLEELGATIFPVLNNEEAVQVARDHAFDLVISDIGRDSGEPGAEIGRRLDTAGCRAPIIFYVGEVILDAEPPFGGIGVVSDPARLLLLTLNALIGDG